MFGMFGLVRRIGCSILLLIIGAVAWQYRDKWLPQVKKKLGTIKVAAAAPALLRTAPLAYRLGAG